MRILFITSTRIGDAVLSTGLLDHLVRVNSAARVTIACGPLAAPLFTVTPGLERIFALTKGISYSHWVRLWAYCVWKRWDIIVDLRRSILPWLLVAGRRHYLGNSHTLVHRVRQIADVLELRIPPAPRLWTMPCHQETADRLLPPSGPPVLGVGPTANWQAKIWRAEHFVTLIKRLIGAEGILPGARVAVFGARSERTQAQPVMDALPPAQRIDLVGTVDLLTAYACLQRCAFYIGNDSGVMHLAAAADIPTLGLFGPSQDLHYAPWGRKGAAVRTAISLTAIYPQNFDHRTTDTLMNSLSVDTAEAAARRLWMNTRNGEAP